MVETYGLPQPLTGAETITIYQMQNSQIALCTMPLSQISAFLFAGWAANLSTTAPTAAGVLWNDNGAVSISS